MTSSLARYLTDFTAASHAPASGSANDGQVSEGIGAAEIRQPIDIEAERASAREEGWTEGRQALQAEHAAQIEDIKARHEAALVSLEQRYQAELAERMAARLAEMRDGIGKAIGHAAAQALVPLVEDAVARSMAEKLAACVCETIGNGQATRLTVHGPAYLFGFLEGLPAMASFDLKHVETDEPDLRIEIDNSVLATRMKALADSLAEAMP